MADSNTSQQELISKAILGQNAFELEEMVIVKGCLIEATDLFDLYFSREEQADEGRKSQLINSSLFRYALILFTACFNTNVKRRNEFLIPAEAFANVRGWEQYYDWILDYRNSFAAHIFGDMRQAKTVALFNPVNYEFSELVCISTLFDKAHSNLYAGIKQLCEVALAHTEERINDLSALVEGEIRELTEEAIRALPDASVFAPETGKNSRDRVRKRHKEHPPEWQRKAIE